MARTYKKRAPKRRFNKRGRRQRLRQIFPKKWIANLPYQDSQSVNPGAGGIFATEVWRLNCVRDPYLTGAGHQCRGFDQYCSTEGSGGFYNKFTVLGCRVSVRFTNTDTTGPNRVFLAARTTSSTPALVNDIFESPDAKSKICGPVGSGTETQVLTMNWSAKKWFGVKDMMDGIAYAGDATNSPVEECYLHVGADGLLGTDTAYVKYEIKLSYLVCFHDPNMPQQS